MFNIKTHPSYIQIEENVPRGIKIIRVYDSQEMFRYMCFIWDEIEHVEMPLSVTIDEITVAHNLAVDERLRQR